MAYVPTEGGLRTAMSHIKMAQAAIVFDEAVRKHNADTLLHRSRKMGKRAFAASKAEYEAAADVYGAACIIHRKELEALRGIAL